MVTLLELPGHCFRYLPGVRPAVFLIAHSEGRGVLVNTPYYTPALRTELAQLAPVNCAFNPSRLGATDTAAWRGARLKTISYGAASPNWDASHGRAGTTSPLRAHGQSDAAGARSARSRVRLVVGLSCKIRDTATVAQLELHAASPPSHTCLKLK